MHRIGKTRDTVIPMIPLQPVVLSPCIGICRLDIAGYCEGCHRTGSEIAAWISFDDATRLRFMDEILPARAIVAAAAE
ncbi:MAG: DUF1289 domain-containing protein [Lysobacteraceae bacterium]